MPANWTDPITWNVDQLVTNDDLNEQIRDNELYLLSPNHTRIIRDNSGDYSITNVTAFQDIDGTNLSISLVTHGGPVLVKFQGVVILGDSEAAMFDISVGGSRLGTAYTQGLCRVTNGATGGSISVPVNLSVLLTGLAANTYVLRPQWMTDSGDTVDLRASTATCPIVFEAIEL